MSGVLYFYMVASDFNEDLDMRGFAGYGILAMLLLCILLGVSNLLSEARFLCKQMTHKLKRKFCIRVKKPVKAKIEPSKPSATGLFCDDDTPYREESIFEESIEEQKYQARLHN